MFKIFFAQIIALITFFAFPIIRYLFLKFSIRKEGQPEIWYLPAFGFRLVIRNIPRRKKLYDIKYRSFLRKIVPNNKYCSVDTYDDVDLNQREDFFLFPTTDQVLISFHLLQNSKNNHFFIYTDKLGNELDRKNFKTFNELICDYIAMVHNWFNFDIRISKRVKITQEDLKKMLHKIEHDNKEQKFQPTEIINVE